MSSRASPQRSERCSCSDAPGTSFSTCAIRASAAAHSACRSCRSSSCCWAGSLPRPCASSGSGPPPHEDAGDREEGEDDDADRHEPEVVLDERNIAEQIAAPDEEQYPAQRAGEVVGEEAAGRHPANARDEGREGANDG